MTSKTPPTAGRRTPPPALRHRCVICGGPAVIRRRGAYYCELDVAVLSPAGRDAARLALKLFGVLLTADAPRDRRPARRRRTA